MSTEDTNQNKQVTPEVTKQVTQDEQKISVDIYGESIELPISTAKKIIEKRDKNSQEYKSLKATIEEKEKVARDATEKANLMEKLKTESYDSIKQELSKETNEKLSKYHSAFIKKELAAELASHPDFIGSSAIEDAVKLLESSTSFSLGDDLSAKTADGKSAKEVVDAFVKAKDVFRRAKVAPGLGIQPKSTTVTKTADVASRFRNGLENLLKK